MTGSRRVLATIAVSALGWLLGPSRVARAADVEVESESVYRSYATPGLTDNEENVVLQPFTQSFRLAAAERKDTLTVAFETYFRGVGDTGNQFDPGIQQSARVYYAFVDVTSGRRNPVDIRVGRQMTATSGDLVAFDGARVRYRGPLHIGLEAFGGTTVSGYGAIVPLGLDDGGAHQSDGVTYGAEVFLVGLPGSQARLAFSRVTRDGQIDREDVVLEGARRVGGRVRLYGNGEVSTVLEKLEEGTLGAAFYAGHAVFFDAEGFHYTPVFGASSIFNVFAVSPYDEARLRVRGTIAEGHAGVWARVGHAIYAGGKSSENVSAGISAAVTTHVALSGRAYLSSGYLGSRVGGGGEAHYLVMDRVGFLLGGTVAEAPPIVGEKSALAPGVASFPLDTQLFLSALGGIEYNVPDRLQLSLLAEEYTDKVTKAAPRITASLRFQFGTGTARRAALDPSARRVH